MDELVKSMKVALATVFSFYLKCHAFHWNVEGSNFFEVHKMFELIYEDVYDSVDPMAEQIRALKAYAPGSFTRFAELSTIEDEVKIPSCEEMIERLLDDNEKVIEVLNAAAKIAQDQNKQGLLNFLADRIDKHNKWGWFLRSAKKEDEGE